MRVGQTERFLASNEALFEIAIFNLDAHRSIVAILAETSNKALPIDFAAAGQFRRMILQGRGENADLVQVFAINPRIFRMNVKYPAAKFPQWPIGIDVLPDQMRG